MPQTIAQRIQIAEEYSAITSTSNGITSTSTGTPLVDAAVRVGTDAGRESIFTVADGEPVESTVESNAGSTVELLVDDIDNSFSLAYGAWPERFIVLEETLGTSDQTEWMVAFLSEPHPDGGHCMDDLERWLEARRMLTQLAGAVQGGGGI